MPSFGPSNRLGPDGGIDADLSGRDVHDCGVFRAAVGGEDLAAWEGGDGEVARVAEQRAASAGQTRPTPEEQGAQVKLLLDTCVFLWLLTGEARRPIESA